MLRSMPPILIGIHGVELELVLGLEVVVLAGAAEERPRAGSSRAGRRRARSGPCCGSSSLASPGSSSRSRTSAAMYSVNRARLRIAAANPASRSTRARRAGGESDQPDAPERCRGHRAERRPALPAGQRANRASLGRVLDSAAREPRSSGNRVPEERPARDDEGRQSQGEQSEIRVPERHPARPRLVSVLDPSKASVDKGKPHDEPHEEAGESERDRKAHE